MSWRSSWATRWPSSKFKIRSSPTVVIILDRILRNSSSRDSQINTWGSSSLNPQEVDTKGSICKSQTRSAHRTHSLSSKLVSPPTSTISRQVLPMSRRIPPSRPLVPTAKTIPLRVKSTLIWGTDRKSSSRHRNFQTLGLIQWPTTTKFSHSSHQARTIKLETSISQEVLSQATGPTEWSRSIQA